MLGITVLCQAVQVDGHCYLENQSNHEGSKVLFQADSPSAVTDSVFTDSLGYYLIDLETGVYDIYYTHEGYYDEDMLDRLLLSNTQLQDVTLIEIFQNQISGALSGVITSGNYRVVGNIFIPQGDSLIIEAGTEFQFDGDYEFDIYGYLYADGNENDSIIFKLTPISVSWDGVDFHDTSDDSSRLEYCLITGSDSSGIWCENSSPTISHCTISENSTYIHHDAGGGIFLIYSDAVIENCRINNNSIYGYMGGGIYIGDFSAPVIRGCTISGNTSASDGSGAGIVCWENSSPFIENCTITYNSIQVSGSGGGIYGISSTATIRNCTIKWNSAGPLGHGGGIYLVGCNATISYCTISGNTAGHSQYPGRGGGIYYTNASPVIDSFIIENCTISDNSVGSNGYGGGIYWTGSSCGPNIVNTIVASNDNGGGIYFSGPSTSVSITYSDFYGNAGGNLIGYYIPEHLGQIVTVNNNGDPCDIFYNIFLNPMFSSGYQLQSGSPCIDAGDPTYPYDPDSTIADIGAFFFDQLWISDPQETPQPTEFHLSQNYPNPFNATTTISYDVPVRGLVKIHIYNVLGQHITTLLNQISDPGTHHLTWNATDSPSGIYFIQLTTSTHTQTIKMVLLK